MANTVIERGSRVGVLHFWRLQDAFEVLAGRLAPDDPARRLIDPWLAHIREELGYVLLDEALLEDREGVRRLRGALVPLAEELERGEAPFPQHEMAKLRDVQGFLDGVARTCRRLAAFLDEVIADQDAEDAGQVPSLTVAE